MEIKNTLKEIINKKISETPSDESEFKKYLQNVDVMCRNTDKLASEKLFADYFASKQEGKIFHYSERLQHFNLKWFKFYTYLLFISLILMLAFGFIPVMESASFASMVIFVISCVGLSINLILMILFDPNYLKYYFGYKKLSTVNKDKLYIARVAFRQTEENNKKYSTKEKTFIFNVLDEYFNDVYYF